jgi:hypothetical protein
MNTNIILIAQNEIFNIVTELMKSYAMTEADMVITLQFVQSKMTQMALTRNAYLENKSIEKTEEAESNETSS